jgi:hypothetical protein
MQLDPKTGEVREASDPGMTPRRAWDLSEWCGETAETIRDHCRNSDRAARAWWENDCDKPEGLASSPRPTEDMLSFADRLQAEGYEWAEAAGSLLAEEQAITATVRVERFSPADELDGPAEGEDMTTPSPAVALRFDFNEELIDYLKTTLKRVRRARSGRGRPLSKMPWAGGWSKASQCWWVLSTYWEEVRQALLDKGVKLTGTLAHPRKVKQGFFEREQTWDVKRCEWQ